MLKLIYYVPDENLEETKKAIFAAGAGGPGSDKGSWPWSARIL